MTSNAFDPADLETPEEVRAEEVEPEDSHLREDAPAEEGLPVPTGRTIPALRETDDADVADQNREVPDDEEYPRLQEEEAEYPFVQEDEEPE